MNDRIQDSEFRIQNLEPIIRDPASGSVILNAAFRLLDAEFRMPRFES
jgi:hypothetical protein